MAKKTNRILIGFTCAVCKSQNYVSQKNKINTADKIGLVKYCKVCKKHTDHKEKQKLK